MNGAEISATPLKVLGRYALHEEIAAGGMASVHFGRLLGPVGFARTVAIKRLHERLARDPEFTAMFLDEARLAARIRHPNVVPTLDVVALEGELFLVMEYVQGEALSRLFTFSRQNDRSTPIATLTTILTGVLHGLHAAHEATDERGQPLGIVHRDVSPQNILVGVDGVPRVLDFGVAKATGRAQSTREGELKGKLSYMAPEQLRGASVTRAADIYAAGVVLWEGLAGRKLFKANTEAELVFMLLDTTIEAPSKFRSDVSAELDAIVLKALASEPAERFASARDMARALEKVAPLVPASDIGEWVEETAGQALTARASKIAHIEHSSSSSLRVSNIPRAIREASLRESESQIGASPSGGPESAKLSQPRLPNFPETESTISEIVPISVESDATASEEHREPASAPDPDAAQPRGKPRDKRLVLLGLGGLLLVSLAFVGVASRSASKTETGVSSSIARSSPSPTTSVDLAASADVARSTPAPLPTTASTATVAVEASSKANVTAATATAPRASATTSPVGTGSRPNAKAAVSAATSCNPPYVVDAQGNRHYKRECLK